MALLGGYERVGGSAFFRRKGRGETPFFIQEKENIYIFGSFGHFVAQKVPKYSKMAQNSLLGSFLSVLSYF
jgi:hypothetical protein